MSVWNDEPSGERTTAPEHADAGTESWREAAGTQSWASSRHEDFYALAGDITHTLGALEEIAGTLARQTERYGTGREVYDDTRGTADAVNPYERLGTAVGHLEQMRGHLIAARIDANSYWSAIGHIGVETYDQPDTTTNDTNDDVMGADW